MGYQSLYPLCLDVSGGIEHRKRPEDQGDFAAGSASSAAGARGYVDGYPAFLCLGLFPARSMESLGLPGRG